MPERGGLIVIEGPPGVGKTTLTDSLASVLATQGIECTTLAFRSARDGTLAAHINRLRDRPADFDVTTISDPSSLELLQIIADADAFRTRVSAEMSDGRWTILDQFWWSSWVCAVSQGLERGVSAAVAATARAAWSDLGPTLTILLERRRPWKKENRTWTELARAFKSLAHDEEEHYPVIRFANDCPIDQTVKDVYALLCNRRHRRTRRRATHGPGALSMRSAFVGRAGQRELFSSSDQPLKPRALAAATPQVFCPVSPAKPSEVYETYWRFAAERQAIFFRRLLGQSPWTTDPILSRYKFTNAYRASDRVSQYLIRNVIYVGEQTPTEIFFRTILFKLFNRIETWELLVAAFGALCYSDFSVDRYCAVLEQEVKTGSPIYSGAYIMPSGSGEFRDERKHKSHLRLLERMIVDRVPDRLGECKSMHQAFDVLRSYPMIGDFLAYQYITDINYSTLCDFAEAEFVIPGPGARDGIRKCFINTGGFNDADLIRWVTERQESEFERLGIPFQTLFGRQLQLIDCQNLFCEVDKYARYAHPDVKGISGRTRIKQLFQPSGARIDYWYPPKWGINGRAMGMQQERRL